MQPDLHPIKRLKELTNYTREWIGENMAHLPAKSSKKWDSRFVHSEKRIKRAFLEFVCEFDNTDLPHGKEAMNKEAKQNLAIGGYDKTRALTGLAQITHGWRNLFSTFYRQCRSERFEKFEFNRIKSWFEELSQALIMSQRDEF
ncbi:Oidioi.mRNA.OKI2018_I69.chr2.g4428.t1.cds [Oikopleura dioica]|uniref:Oidioi.mRNA.OKI2018_I69.chr2.g4428.t1.cds n=1 Tax=Oikopleura dioica TaxID=34765 RepID=A0ABN7T0R1_OIKDI|nr:Oidioi.mRNA.OKI2018_I69.chr2.g4428.t1.cds [Oikopleura dioica]